MCMRPSKNGYDSNLSFRQRYNRDLDFLSWAAEAKKKLTHLAEKRNLSG